MHLGSAVVYANQCHTLLRLLKLGDKLLKPPVANTVIHAADCKANLQVFCREKSGNECPVSICL